MTEVVAKQEASSKPPEELTYRILQGACIKLKDNACVTDQLEKLVIHYPKPQYWQDLMSLLMAQTKNNNQLLNMWRLADGNDVLQDPAEFLEMAQLAIGQGLPGEAQAVLEKGSQKGVFKTASQKEQANQLHERSEAGRDARQEHARQAGRRGARQTHGRQRREARRRLSELRRASRRPSRPCSVASPRAA